MRVPVIAVESPPEMSVGERIAGYFRNLPVQPMRSLPTSFIPTAGPIIHPQAPQDDFFRQLIGEV
jgi:hypothetical protein